MTLYFMFLDNVQITNCASYWQQDRITYDMSPLVKKYKVLIDFDFHVNEKLLNILYLPIVGAESIMLYHFLVTNHNYQQGLGNIFNFEINYVMEHLNIDSNALQTHLEKLEACELLKTYVDANKQDLIVYHIYEPLKWQAFKQHAHLYNLLKQSITVIEFEKIKYLFENQQALAGLVNISKTFDTVYKLNQTYGLNFELLYDFMFKHTNRMISLSDEIKAKLDSAYVKWNVSYTEIYQVLTSSFLKQDHSITIDEQLIELNIKKVIDTKNVNQFNLQLKINRNQKIFLKDADLSIFTYVIEDYKALNSEQYLACIQKHPINELDKNLIINLRKNFQLPDFLINILIDYSIFKNAGRVEPMYLHKIALTINRLNITSIQAVLKHLQTANQEHHKQVYQGNDKVNW